MELDLTGRHNHYRVFLLLSFLHPVVSTEPAVCVVNVILNNFADFQFLQGLHLLKIFAK